MGMRNWVKQQIFTLFKELYDTPDDYTGHGDKYVKVKAAEDGLEFDTPAASADEKVKASSGDSTPDYLWKTADTGKMRGGSNVTLVLVDNGGNKHVRIDASGGGGSGALGADGVILSGETETTVVFTGEAGNFNRAVATNVGLNGGQRQPFIKTAPYDDGADLKVDVAIDSSYLEDIDVHVVLANE